MPVGYALLWMPINSLVSCAPRPVKAPIVSPDQPAARLTPAFSRCRVATIS